VVGVELTVVEEPLTAPLVLDPFAELDELDDLLEVELELELDFEVLEPVDPELCLPC
jgi:hypothetical protein